MTYNKFLSFGSTCCLHSEDRGSRYLWKVGTFLPNYTESYVTRQQSSKSHHHVGPHSRRRIAAVDPQPTASGQNDTGKDFSPIISFLACQYHSTNAAYSDFIHLLSTLYELGDCQICRNKLHSLEILESHEFDLWQFYVFRSGVSHEGCNPVGEYKPIWRIKNASCKLGITVISILPFLTKLYVQDL